MNQTIYPTQLLKTVFKGYSKPQHMLFSDGQTYVVKLKNNPSGTRILVNEYIAGNLGKLLKLPVVPFEVVQIEEAFIKESPILAKHKFQPGSQFASLYLDNCSQLVRNSRNENVKVSNRQHLAEIIAFDLWIGNTDRKENNVLLEPLEHGEFYLHLIDHGRCFSKALWTSKSLKKMPKMEIDLNVHKWCAGFLENAAELQAAIEKIKAIPQEAIHQVIESIPSDWDVTEEEREALVGHLVNARKCLDHLKLSSYKRKK